MVETGAFIMQMDPVGMSEDINESIDASAEALKEKTQEIVEDATKEQIQKIEKNLKEN
jgi:hypothetical protein